MIQCLICGSNGKIVNKKEKRKTGETQHFFTCRILLSFPHGLTDCTSARLDMEVMGFLILESGILKIVK